MADALAPAIAGALASMVALYVCRHQGTALAGVPGDSPRRLDAEHDRLNPEPGRRREQPARELSDPDDTLTEERIFHDRLERARQAEHKKNRELRAQIMRMREDAGSLDDSGVEAMVLHVATALLGAEKGLLLARQDNGSGKDFELVCAEGFKTDPTDSAVANRFAAEVIERDTTVREDDWRTIDAQRRTAADDEIENLVAIPIYIQDGLNGVVVCANRRDADEDYDDSVLLSLGDHAGAVIENTRLQRKLRSYYLSTVRMLSEAIEAKDPFLRSHSEEVASYVGAVADRLGVAPAHREELIFGSLLHDVGKIGISERILLKPARLTPDELSIVQLHPRIGYRLVQQVPALRPIAEAILHHHERFDGDGYPAHLRGEKIPLEARIICVADAFSAMTNERPYLRSLSVAEACTELERCAGTQFDPDIVRIFIEEVWRRPASAEPTAAPMDLPDIVDASDEPALSHGLHVLTDNLTLLYSHRYFHDAADAQARRATAEDRRFSVVLVELQEIDQLNRGSGYGAGDSAIRTAARVVQRVSVRSMGTACRYSGRRLGLIVPDAGEQDARRIAEQITSELAGGPNVRASVAQWRSGDSGDDVIARARKGFDAGAARAA